MPIKTNQRAQKAIERKEQAKVEKEAKLKKEKEKELEERWSQGAKDQSKKAEQEKKKKEAIIKKAEREKLLSEEINDIKPIKRSPNVGSKIQAQKPSSKIIEREEKIDTISREITSHNEIEEYSAGGIDKALDLLHLTKSNAGPHEKLERHPERRIKSAWASFEEREMALIKAEKPGLRLSQYKHLLQKKWKKSEENPMNQLNISYNTTREEEQEFANQKRQMLLEEMRVNK